MGTLIANANLIKKVYFPREILVASADRLAGRCTFAASSWPCCRGALLFVGNIVLPWIPVVLLVLADPDRVRARARAGAGVLQRLLPRRAALRRHPAAALVLLDADRLSALARAEARRRSSASTSRCATLYELNPMVRFVEAYRDLLYDLRFPPLGDARCTSLGVALGTARSSARASSAGSSRASRRSCERRPRDHASTDVSKRFRLYHERNQSLKVALMRGGAPRTRSSGRSTTCRFEVAARARPSGSSARTARARAPCSSAWPGSCGPTRAASTCDGQDVGAARARRRLPPRAVRARQRLPQRLDPRAVARSSSTRSSTRSSTSPASSSSSTRR